MKVCLYMKEERKEKRKWKVEWVLRFMRSEDIQKD